MDVVKAICGLILICFGVWLFIKLIFHPILFELDLQNKGKKGISFIMTGIQIAGIIAMYICYGEHDQGAIDASIGFTDLGLDTGMAPPQIRVCIDRYLIPVTISENPEVIAGNIYECRDDILLWVSKHFKVLEAHWNHQFDDPDVHEELKKENHNNTVVAVI